MRGSGSRSCWSDVAELRFSSLLHALRRYHGTAGWLLTNPPAGPNALVILETALAALVDAGLDDEQAAVGSDDLFDAGLRVIIDGIRAGS